MQLGLEKFAGQLAFQRYERGLIALNDGQILRQSAWLFQKQLMANWPPQTVADLQPIHFAALLELRPELVILGTGKKLVFPTPTVMGEFAQHHIGLEVMDTGAACRTYNLLLAEGRPVGAALFMIES